MLLFSPSIHTSSARLTTSVEVKEGESYEWVIKLNISNYIELIRNTGDGTISPEILALELTGDSDGLLIITANFQILNIPDNFVVDSFFDITYTIVEAELTIAPDYNISQIPIFFPLNFSIKPSPIRANFSVLKGDTPNYFSAPIGFFLIVPTDLDWATTATQLQSYLGRNIVSSNYTVSRRDNGLRIVQPADTNIIASELSLNYNSRGVLESAVGIHGGPLLFSIEYQGDDSIAFEIPFLLGIAASVVVILILRKRKKYTLIS